MQDQSRSSSSLFNKLSNTMSPGSQKILQRAVPQTATQQPPAQPAPTNPVPVQPTAVPQTDAQLDALEQAVTAAEQQAQVQAQQQAQARQAQLQAQQTQQDTASPPVQVAPQTTVPAGVVGQAIPVAAAQIPDELNPPAVSRGAKETVAATSPDVASLEAGGPIQYVESKEFGEISPEVGDFLKKVEDKQDQAPKEVVIADGSQPMPAQKYPSKPVVVIPITPEVEKKGKRKSPKFSIRWLVEWSRKIIKAFKGAVVYRKAEEEAK